MNVKALGLWGFGAHFSFLFCCCGLAGISCAGFSRGAPKRNISAPTTSTSSSDRAINFCSAGGGRHEFCSSSRGLVGDVRLHHPTSLLQIRWSGPWNSYRAVRQAARAGRPILLSTDSFPHANAIHLIHSFICRQPNKYFLSLIIAVSFYLTRSSQRKQRIFTHIQLNSTQSIYKQS